MRVGRLFVVFAGASAVGFVAALLWPRRVTSRRDLAKAKPAVNPDLGLAAESRDTESKDAESKDSA